MTNGYLHRIILLVLKQKPYYHTKFVDQIISQTITSGHGDAYAIPTWNSLIRAYSKSPTPIKSILLYKHCIPIESTDHYTYPPLLKACSRLCSVINGTQVHGRMIRKGLDFDVYVGNGLVNFYGSVGNVSDARKVFDEMFVRDIASWNSLMSVYIGNFETVVDVLVVFNKLVSEDVKPDGISFVVVLSACAQAQALCYVLDYGRGLHGYVIKVGLGWNLNVNNSLLDMYIKNEEMSAASILYSEMGFMRDVVSDTILIRGYVEMGLIDLACNVFDRIVDTDLVVWNSLIHGLVKANRPKNALELFKRMVNEKVRPDEHTMASVLAACGNLSDLQFGRQAHNFIGREFIKQDVLLKTALIEMYFKCGSIEEALVVFYKMRDKFDVFTWSVVIEGLANNGYGVETLSLFNQMERQGIEPNEVTFVSLLSACRRSGLLKEGSELFRRMVEVYNFECKLEHFGCVVDLLSKSGFLHQAEELIELLPPEQRLIAYKSLLSACIDYSDIDLGRKVAGKMVKFNSKNQEVHILLSNFYALAGQWEQVAETRRITKGLGTRKEPGKSFCWKLNP